MSDDEPQDESADDPEQPSEERFTENDQSAEQAEEQPAESDQPADQAEKQSRDSDQPAEQSHDTGASSPVAASRTTEILSKVFVDYYESDKGPDLAAVSADERYAGAILKATEGLYYTGGAWFPREWSSAHNQAEYGDTWFRGCYHFLKFNQDGTAQADFYLRNVDAAGGCDKGDLWPIVDVELGSQGNPARNIKRNSNQDASAQQIIDCTTAFAERCTSETGRKVMLYGNGAMRDRNIKDRMGCDWLWCPRYTATLPTFIYERAGWSLEQLVFWQYAGDGTGFLSGYPTTTPDGKKIDHSVLVLTGGLARLLSLL